VHGVTQYIQRHAATARTAEHGRAASIRLKLFGAVLGSSPRIELLVRAILDLHFLPSTGDPLPAAHHTPRFQPGFDAPHVPRSRGRGEVYDYTLTGQVPTADPLPENNEARDWCPF